MSAVLPLLGGLLLGRFVANRRVAIAVQVAFFAIAATVLIASAPSHGASHGEGLLLAVILAPVSAATLALGGVWQHRTVGLAR
jgi:drug/metabolite transporter (DMT)-like permease